jgi:hypothetical protein
LTITFNGINFINKITVIEQSITNFNRNLPHTNGGTGTYRYAFVIGTLATGGIQKWDSPVYSNVIKGSNPIWSDNLHNITYLNIYIPEVGVGFWGVRRNKMVSVGLSNSNCLYL